jgi:hypothetical protein
MLKGNDLRAWTKQKGVDKPGKLYGGVGYVTKSPPDAILRRSVEPGTSYDREDMMAHSQIVRR